MGYRRGKEYMPNGPEAMQYHVDSLPSVMRCRYVLERRYLAVRSLRYSNYRRVIATAFDFDGPIPGPRFLCRCHLVGSCSILPGRYKNGRIVTSQRYFSTMARIADRWVHAEAQS